MASNSSDRRLRSHVRLFPELELEPVAFPAARSTLIARSPERNRRFSIGDPDSFSSNRENERSVNELENAEVFVRQENERAESINQIVSVNTAHVVNMEGDNGNNVANLTLGSLYNPNRKPATPKFTSPTTFDPDLDDVYEFIRNYETTAIQNNWDDNLKLNYFGSYLKGQAQVWYRIYAQTNPDANWVTLMIDFRREFLYNVHAGEFKTKLRYRRQRENEPIINYLRDILYLCLQVDPNMAENVKREHFEQGLLPKYLYDIKMKKLGTFDEVKEFVKTINETEMEVLKCTNLSSPAFATFSGNSVNRQLPSVQKEQKDIAEIVKEEVTKALQNLNLGNNSKPSSSGLPPRQGSQNYNPSNNFNKNFRSRTVNSKPVCFSCGKPGHTSRMCWRVAPQSSQNLNNFYQNRLPQYNNFVRPQNIQNVQNAPRPYDTRYTNYQNGASNNFVQSPPHTPQFQPNSNNQGIRENSNGQC